MHRQTCIFICSMLLAAAGVSSFRVVGAHAQDPDCRDYTGTDFYLQSPLNNNANRRTEPWHDNLVMLQDDGVHLVSLADPLAPVVVASLAGQFSDVALDGDTVFLGGQGGIVVASLPDLVPLATLPDSVLVAPSLATDGHTLAVAEGPLLRLLDVSNPLAPDPLGEIVAPRYVSLLGLGRLQFAGDFLLAHVFGGTNNISGYHSAIAVFDISDPTQITESDYVTLMPESDPEKITFFLDLQPLDGGFLVAGLQNVSERPQDEINDHFLVRFRLGTDGRIVWYGSVWTRGRMPVGLLVQGDLALWTIDGSSVAADVSWDNNAPVGLLTDNRFPSGPMVWTPSREVLAVGSRLFHFGGIRTGQPGTFFAGYDKVRYQMIDASYQVQLRWSTGDWREPGAWLLMIHDLSADPVRLVDSTGGDYFSISNMVVVGRRVYLQLATGWSYFKVQPDGSLSAPVAAQLPQLQTSLAWAEYWVAAHAGAATVLYSIDEQGQPTPVLTLPVPPNTTALLRLGDVLMVRSPDATVYLDMSVPLSPTFIAQTGPLTGRLRFFAEPGLLFRIDGPLVQWFDCAGSSVPLASGTWTSTAAAVFDVWLSASTLYLLQDDAGMAMFTFDPAVGLVQTGGDTGVGGAVFLPLTNARLATGFSYQPFLPDCADPLPVAVSGFRASGSADQVNLSWDCRVQDDVASDFVLLREYSGNTRRIATFPLRLGTYHTTDTLPGVTGTVTYRLAQSRSGGPLTVLDSVTLQLAASSRLPGGMVISPNPANPAVRVQFSLPRADRVRLGIYGLDGRHIIDLVDGPLPPGDHVRNWRGRDKSGQKVPSGTYLLRLTASASLTTGRLTLVR